MGSSEAAGYVTPGRGLTDWLSELAFAPVDDRADAPADEWAGDRGVGAQYLSQAAAIRLAETAGLPLPAGATPADQLKAIQAAHAKGDERAANVFVSIGRFLGYALARYADFYDIRHALMLGRVTSGAGGPLIRAEAEAVLKAEFPDLAASIALHLPEDELERRHGQAVAAASLVDLRKAAA
jgi:predicted NBD/HSP70 family sugar kinase